MHQQQQLSPPLVSVSATRRFASRQPLALIPLAVLRTASTINQTTRSVVHLKGGGGFYFGTTLLCKRYHSNCLSSKTHFVPHFIHGWRHCRSGLRIVPLSMDIVLFVTTAVAYRYSLSAASSSSSTLFERRSWLRRRRSNSFCKRHGSHDCDHHVSFDDKPIILLAAAPANDNDDDVDSDGGIATMDLELLQKQSAETSSALIDYYNSNQADATAAAHFITLSKYEGDLTVQRDDEDATKLQLGIDYAKSKGVIDPNFEPEPYVQIDVLGKSPDQVADTILQHVMKSVTPTASTNEPPSKTVQEGSVIVLVGLSGTGKGTTVTKLRQKLEQDYHKQVITWSNGNVFRSVTLLAATWCEQNVPAGVFDADKALTKENVATFMKMLSFDDFNKNGQFDIRIQGYGLDLYVSQIQNTVLKAPNVSKNIPTVAQYIQGEVILFAAAAVQTMTHAGLFVLLEGREQTVNYVRSPYRFTLILSDGSLIGKRRAAQRLMAMALEQLDNNNNNNTMVSSSSGRDSRSMNAILNRCLEQMAHEIETTSN